MKASIHAAFKNEKEILDKFFLVLNQHKDELKNKFGVKEIGIFGSYIRGDQKRSDLDIFVSFEDDDKMDLIKFIELEEYFSELLGVKVDLVLKYTLKPRIQKTNTKRKSIYERGDY